MRPSLLLCAFLATSALAVSPVPRPVPPLEIVDSGGRHTVSSYKGKVVVVQFLLTDCIHCQAFSQLLSACQAQYGPRGFQALGGAVNDVTAEKLRDYSAQYAIGFPVGPIPRDPMLGFLGLSPMDRLSFPQIAVIDRKGQIREQTTIDTSVRQPLQEEAHLRALIEKLLAESAR